MTAAEIVPYGSPNVDLAAEVERLRLQVAQYEGAGGAHPDHQYDRYAGNASHAHMLLAAQLNIAEGSFGRAQDNNRLCSLCCSDYFDANPTPDDLQMQEDRTLEYTNGDIYKVRMFSFDISCICQRCLSMRYALSTHGQRRGTRSGTCGMAKVSTPPRTATLTRGTGALTNDTVAERPHWPLACSMRETGLMTKLMGGSDASSTVSARYGPLPSCNFCWMPC